MNVNYEAIRLANIEEYGKGTRHLAYLSDLYSTRTHFIFELLQNTEDAIARAGERNQKGFAEFRLYADRLELHHNGKPFDEEDIRGICGIGEGTKAGDFSQIGKFGVGFKAVYSYTLAPQIHSGREHFKIRRFVEPHHMDVDSEHAELSGNNQTVIVLPFDSEELIGFRERVPPNVAVAEIGKALKTLHPRALLFLQHIREVRWVLPDGECGSIRRRSRLISDNRAARVVNLFFGHQRERWLVFEQETQIEDFKRQKAKLEVAFQMKGRSVVQAQHTELVVFFPTKMRTGLGFLIQAPFKTKVTRESLDEECEGNRGLLMTAAKLASERLEFLRDIGRLKSHSYTALPIAVSDFPAGSFCRPVFTEIRDAIKTRNLLPAHPGPPDDPKFICGNQAVAASDPELRELLTNDELKEALGGDTDWHWLAEDMSLAGDGALAVYLRDEIEIRGFSADDFVSWLETKDADWWKALDETCLLSTYRYLNAQASEDKHLRKLPLVRLESGEHISPDEQAVFFPADNIHEKEELAPFLPQLPIIRQALLDDDEDKSVESFFRKIGVARLIASEFIRHYFVPRFESDKKPNVADALALGRYLFCAFQRMKEAERQEVTGQVSELNWLLCRTESKPDTNYLNSASHIYIGGEYTGSTNLEHFFATSPNIFFVHKGYGKTGENWLAFLGELGCSDIPRRTSDMHDMEGLDKALTDLRAKTELDERIRLVNSIVSVIAGHVPVHEWERDSCFLVRETIWGPRGGNHGSRNVDAKFWATLKQTSWLPDSDGNLRKPNALFEDNQLNRRLLGDSASYLHTEVALDSEGAKWLATKMGIRFTPNKEAVLSCLKKMPQRGTALTEVLPLYEFLSRTVGADDADVFEDAKLIFCPDSDQNWRPPSEVFWNDESTVFGSTRAYLKNHYPSLQDFFSKVGVRASASPANYAEALLEIANSGTADDAPRSRIHRIYKRLELLFDEGGDWQEEETWETCWAHLISGRFWLGRKGNDFGFYPLSELVVVDNEHLEKLFHGEVVFWPFKELNDFAKEHLKVETCSTAEQGFQIEGEGDRQDALSAQLTTIWPCIGDFLQSDKWRGDLLKGRKFTDFLPMIRSAGKIAVIYTLKKAEAEEPDGKAAFFDSAEKTVWLVRYDANDGDEHFEALSEALQEYFGPEPLREFIYDLFRKGIEKAEVKWRKRGLMARRAVSAEPPPTEAVPNNSREAAGEAAAGDGDQSETVTVSSGAAAVPDIHVNSPCAGTSGVEPAPFGDTLEAALNKPGKTSESPQAPERSPVSNPERRREQTETEIVAAREKEPRQGERHKTLPRTVWESKNSEARSKLKEWYGGSCQICGETFRKRNGENYFEACYLVPRTAEGAAWLDRVGNTLCLCADCSAKFQFGSKESPPEIQKKIADLKLVKEGGTQPHTVSIRLCDQEVAIKFDERHLIDLQTMLKVDLTGRASALHLIQCPHCQSKVRSDRLHKHVKNVHDPKQNWVPLRSSQSSGGQTRLCKNGCGRSALPGMEYCSRCMR